MYGARRQYEGREIEGYCDHLRKKKFMKHGHMQESSHVNPRYVQRRNFNTYAFWRKSERSELSEISHLTKFRRNLHVERIPASSVSFSLHFFYSFAMFFIFKFYVFEFLFSNTYFYLNRSGASYPLMDRLIGANYVGVVLGKLTFFARLT